MPLDQAPPASELLVQTTSSQSVVTLTGGSSAWATGDYKVSAQTTSHDDPGGGRWILCDGSAIDAQYAALIAMVGSNAPDAQGRGLWMKGTHADVDTIGDSDGVTLASRRPKHKSSIVQTINAALNFAATRAFTNGSDTPADSTTNGSGQDRHFTSPSDVVIGTQPVFTVGPQTGAEPTDTPSYVVVGCLFIHS